MTGTTKRATVYFDPVMHRALQHKSLETARSISDLVNDAVYTALAEDAEDLAAFEERVQDEVLLRESVRKDIAAIPATDLRRIMVRIGELATNPRPPDCRKLTSQEKYRIRQGNYRIIYSIQDEQLTVWVVKVGHRGSVYKH